MDTTTTKNIGDGLELAFVTMRAHAHRRSLERFEEARTIAAHVASALQGEPYPEGRFQRYVCDLMAMHCDLKGSPIFRPSDAEVWGSYLLTCASLAADLEMFEGGTRNVLEWVLGFLERYGLKLVGHTGEHTFEVKATWESDSIDPLLDEVATFDAYAHTMFEALNGEGAEIVETMERKPPADWEAWNHQHSAMVCGFMEFCIDEVDQLTPRLRWMNTPQHAAEAGRLDAQRALYEKVLAAYQSDNAEGRA